MPPLPIAANVEAGGEVDAAVGDHSPARGSDRRLRADRARHGCRRSRHPGRAAAGDRAPADADPYRCPLVVAIAQRNHVPIRERDARLGDAKRNAGATADAVPDARPFTAGIHARRRMVFAADDPQDRRPYL